MSVKTQRLSYARFLHDASAAGMELYPAILESSFTDLWNYIPLIVVRK